MTYQEANSISIKDYLESLGILPVVDKLYYGMYSPLRQDDTPSFKVDYGVNLWCDFGTGEGRLAHRPCDETVRMQRLQGYQPTGTGLLLRQYFFFLFKGKISPKRIRQGRKGSDQPAR